MITTGTSTSTHPEAAPEAPAILPGLAGLNLLAALDREHRRLAFLAEHTCHPLVSEGVADAIADAEHAITHARRLQRDLCWGTEL
jgi:hypothetical protein